MDRAPAVADPSPTTDRSPVDRAPADGAPVVLADPPPTVVVADPPLADPAAAPSTVVDDQTLLFSAVTVVDDQKPQFSAVPTAATAVPDTAFLCGLLGYDAAVVIGLVTELGCVAAWNAAPQVAFGVVLLTVTVLLLPVALMAALKNRLSLSSLCAKLAAIILTDLLVVAISTRFGRWGNVAAGLLCPPPQS